MITNRMRDEYDILHTISSKQEFDYFLKVVQSRQKGKYICTLCVGFPLHLKYEND